VRGRVACHVLGRAGGHHGAAALAALGAEVDEPVRALHHVQAVLDDHQRVAGVGEALQQISEDKEVSEAMFEILETQKVMGSGARLTVLPRNSELLAQLIAGNAENAGHAGQPPPL
jgi:hypothetical protein